MTASWFEPGQTSGDTRVGITGSVLEFGVRVIRSGLHEYHSVIGCKIALEAHEAGSGQKLWEKTYSRHEEGVSRTLASAVPERHWPSLSRVLAAVVGEVVNDPELLQVLQFDTICLRLTKKMDNFLNLIFYIDKFYPFDEILRKF